MAACVQRMVLKTRYFFVDEDGCGTCCAALFCRWCLIAANYREATARNMFPGGVLCAARPNPRLYQLKPPMPPQNLEDFHN